MLRGESENAETGKSKVDEEPKGSGGSNNGTPRGAAGDLILAGLCVWHKYDGTGILKDTPIGVRELAKKCNLPGHSVVSKWFKAKFGGHKKYQTKCCDSSLLLHSLKTMNGDYNPDALITDTKALADPSD